VGGHVGLRRRELVTLNHMFQSMLSIPEILNRSQLGGAYHMQVTREKQRGRNVGCPCIASMSLDSSTTILNQIKLSSSNHAKSLIWTTHVKSGSPLHPTRRDKSALMLGWYMAD
jgi:hypothetical protein